MKLWTLVGIVFGFLFIASAFVPLGPYHNEGGLDISGTLWNFMLPTGWLGIISGVILLLHEAVGMKSKLLAYAIFTTSLLLILLFLLQDADYFISLWNGVSGLDFDVDAQWFLAPVSFYLGIIGVFTSLLLMILRNSFSLSHKTDSQTIN